MKNIPKTINLYWDRSPMAFLQTLTIDSFCKYNPDWNINVYIPDQPFTGGQNYVPNYTGKDYFSRVENNPRVNIVNFDLNDFGVRPDIHDILRADIFKYRLMYEVGGVYADFDIIWLKPMSHFYNIEYIGNTPIDDVSAVVSFIKETQGGHSIGIMIHRKHDPYAKALVELSQQVKPPFSHEVFGSPMISRVYPSLSSMSSFENIVAVKHETYYPYDIHPPNPTIHKLYNDNDLSCINNNVICLHWYNGHRLSKLYINTEGHTRSCSMTTLLKEEGYI